MKQAYHLMTYRASPLLPWPSTRRIMLECPRYSPLGWIDSALNISAFLVHAYMRIYIHCFSNSSIHIIVSTTHLPPPHLIKGNLIKLAKMNPTRSAMIRFGGKAGFEALVGGFRNTVETANKSIETRVSDWLSSFSNMELTSVSD